MQSYYLDANIIRNLIEPRDLWPQTAKALRRLVGAGACAVLGSVDLLEELTSLARSDAERYGRAMELFWSTIGHKVLRPVGELIDLEIRTGAAAPRRAACFDSGTVRELRALSSDSSEMGPLQEAVRRLKRRYEETWNGIGDSVDAQAGPVGDGLVICEESVQSWFLEWARGRREHLRLSVEHVNSLHIGRLPCLRASLSFPMAQVRRRHRPGAEERFRANDFYDGRHYGLAAMAGCLVTEDNRLRRIVGEIEYEPVPLMTGEEFSRRLLDHAGASGAALRE